MRQYVSLCGRREFTLALRRGAVASTKALTVYAFSPRQRNHAPAKVGVIVTKKVGKAVVRNRVRRRCKAILDAAIGATPGLWYVVQCRPMTAALSFAELRTQLSDAVVRAAALRMKRP